MRGVTKSWFTNNAFILCDKAEAETEAGATPLHIFFPRKYYEKIHISCQENEKDGPFQQRALQSRRTRSPRVF